MDLEELASLLDELSSLEVAGHSLESELTLLDAAPIEEPPPVPEPSHGPDETRAAEAEAMALPLASFSTLPVPPIQVVVEEEAHGEEPEKEAVQTGGSSPVLVFDAPTELQFEEEPAFEYGSPLSTPSSSSSVHTSPLGQPSGPLDDPPSAATLSPTPLQPVAVRPTSRTLRNLSLRRGALPTHAPAPLPDIPQRTDLASPEPSGSEPSGSEPSGSEPSGSERVFKQKSASGDLKRESSTQLGIGSIKAESDPASAGGRRPGPVREPPPSPSGQAEEGVPHFTQKFGKLDSQQKLRMAEELLKEEAGDEADASPTAGSGGGGAMSGVNRRLGLLKRQYSTVRAMGKRREAPSETSSVLLAPGRASASLGTGEAGGGAALLMQHHRMGGAEGSRVADTDRGGMGGLASWVSAPLEARSWDKLGSAIVTCPLLDLTDEGFQFDSGPPTSKAVMPEALHIALFLQDRYTPHFVQFASQPHVHYVNNEDSGLGPVVISVEGSKARSAEPDGHVRVLIRTKRGDDRRLMPASYSGKETKWLQQAEGLGALGGLKYTRVASEELSKELVKLEHKLCEQRYKFGVLYCKPGQKDEHDMYCNEHGSPAFERFLQLIGRRVPLQGWTKFRGGLDVRAGSTGAESVYTEIAGIEIMYHVSTLITYTPGDPQQVERKRHLGNDLIMLIFCDSVRGMEPFELNKVRSQFNHVFIVVAVDEKVSAEMDETYYRVQVGAKFGVRAFPPDLPSDGLFSHSELFGRWLVAKMINGERAAMFAPDFAGKVSTTRQMHLDSLIQSALGPTTSASARRSNSTKFVSLSDSPLTPHSPLSVSPVTSHRVL